MGSIRALQPKGVAEMVEQTLGAGDLRGVEAGLRVTVSLALLESGEAERRRRQLAVIARLLLRAAELEAKVSK